MKKVRVYEIAKRLNQDHKSMVALLQSLGYAEVRNHMSAVDEEAVERVKRHIERDKTPPVVEQWVAPTVVKRKAAARPSTGLNRPSSPSASPVPTPPPVAPVVALPVKRTRAAVPTDAGEADNAKRAAALTRKSSAGAAPPPPPPPPEPPAPPVAPPPEPEPVAEVAAPAPAPAELEPQPAVAAPVPVPEPEPEPEPPQPEPAVELAPVTLTVVQSAPEPTQDTSSEAAEPPAPAPVAQAAPEPQPAPAPREVPPPPPPPAQLSAPEPARVDSSPPPRPVPSQPPRTGIDVWEGRPGVPMRQPPVARAQPAPVPRRVQFDPRAVTAGGKTDQRRQGASGNKAWGGKAKQRAAQSQQPVKKPAVPSTKEMAEHKKIIKIEEKIALQTLAQRMSLKATEVLVKLLSMGMPGVNINSTLDADTAKLVASEFGWEVEDVAISEEEALGLARDESDGDGGSTIIRPPIVTVMGHVDHGKTSLLDQIRKSNVAASEAGGITQHIGAYKVNTSRGQICFLDTPGHAAFTQMRARGAQVTDLVILVVAADDGVMPQTREAVNHARAAKVPIIVAVNKIDKPGAQPERIRRELAEMDLVPEEWGGETIYCNVSAKTREGIDTLLEMTALQAEILELRANPSRPAVGTVLEALLDRGRGPVARVVVTDGTLRTGDVVLAGASWGKVRAMTDDRGRQVAEAGPSTPVEILGLSEVPSAGDPIHVVKDAKKAQEIAASRRSKLSRSLIPVSAKVTLEELARRIATEDQLELRLIIKADVQGSVEALAESLAGLSGEKVRVAIIHAAVGGITEGDVNLAVASKAIIVGFNVRPAGKAGALAEAEGIEIRLYNVIYDAVDEIKKAMIGMIGPTIVEKNLGRAEVRQTFHIAKVGTVAGCIVSEGILRRNAKVRLVRDAVQVWEGKLSGLKRFKEDAKEVDKGFECGVSLEGYNDIKVGDIIECYEEQQVQATL